MSTLEIDLVVGRAAARSLDIASALLRDASVELGGATLAATLGPEGAEIGRRCATASVDVERVSRLLGLVAERAEHADAASPALDEWIDRVGADVARSVGERATAVSPPVEGPWGWGPPTRSLSELTPSDHFMEANDAIGVTVPAGTDVAAVASILDQLQTRQHDHGHPANATNILANELFGAAVARGDLVLNDEGWYEARGCDGECWPSQPGTTASRLILGFENQAEAEAMAEGQLDMLGVATGVLSGQILSGILKRIRPGAEAALPTRVVTTKDLTYGGASPPVVQRPGVGRLDQDARRGLSPLGGVIELTETNAAGGRIYASTGAINQNDFVGMVNSGVVRGDEVHIFTGAHGLPDGSLVLDAGLLADDVARFGDTPGVHIHDLPSMSVEEVRAIVEGPGTIIGGFCDSRACLAEIGG